MKIFTSNQIREIDRYTIENEPVSSVDLMERAAGKLFEWFVKQYQRSRPVVVVSGPGNNGGDGLVMARLLSHAGYNVSVISAGTGADKSPDWKINRQRLEGCPGVQFTTVVSMNKFPFISSDCIIIDALFGSGLSRPVSGFAAQVIEAMNTSGAEIVSIDVPSGLSCEDPSMASTIAVKAVHTVSFQFPKLSFMFPESLAFTGECHIVPIGLNTDAIIRTGTPYYLLEASDILKRLKTRKRFDHKGTYGHGLLVAGSREKAGAAILSSKAVLRAGAGLVTCHLPSSCTSVLQAAVPEAMADPDINESFVTEIGDTGIFSAVAAGPGLGKEPLTVQALLSLIEKCNKPLVLDADALNILSLQKDWPGLLKPGTILTPHPGEFGRLCGKTSGGFEWMKMQAALSEKYKIIIVLKGAHTSVSTPGGNIYFNSTGNPGMATAGSGDVLTGIILSLLSQGYDPMEAALTAVYIHGLAGDIAAAKRSVEAVIASDISECLGEAYNLLREQGSN